MQTWSRAPIGTVSISGPRAALQRRRQKYGSLTSRGGYRFLSSVHHQRHPVATIAKPLLNSLRPSDAYICVVNLTIIGLDNGLSPGRRQFITWSNVGILLIEPLGTNCSEMLIEIYTFSFQKIHSKTSSEKWRPFCPGLNVLTHWGRDNMAATFQTTFQTHLLEWKCINFA